MKKVLAFAMAAVMLCSVAFGLSIGNENDFDGTTAAENIYMHSVTPGQSIVFTQEELGLNDSNWGKTDGNFDPAKNKVTITFAVGNELITSQGWIKTDATTYKYVVNTKASETAVLDNNADLIISAIKVTVYGVSKPILDAKYVKDVSGVTHYAYVDSVEALASFKVNEPGENFCAMNEKAEDHVLAMAFDYGRKSDDTNATFDKNGVVVNSIDLTGKTIYTVKAATVDGKYVNSGVWSVSAQENGGGKITASVTLNAGDKVYFGTVNKANLSANAQKTFLDNLNRHSATIKASYGYESAQNTINKTLQFAVDGMRAEYRAYMINRDGTATRLDTTFDKENGILSFSGLLTGPVVVTDKALSATSSGSGSGSGSSSSGSDSSSSGSNGGSQTNPETGSNSIVGAAVALAAVTAVSAAAISLKKR